MRGPPEEEPKILALGINGSVSFGGGSGGGGSGAAVAAVVAVVVLEVMLDVIAVAGAPSYFLVLLVRSYNRGRGKLMSFPPGWVLLLYNWPMSKAVLFVDAVYQSINQSINE
jgi:hypothetical protein